MTAPVAWNIVAAILTLAIFSYLYKDNPFYKLAEYLFVGIGTGYWLCLEYQTVLVPNLFHKLGEGELVLLIPLLLGLLLFARFWPRRAWLSRWPMGLMVGAFAGIGVIGFLQSELLTQVQASLVSVTTSDPATNANNVVLIVGLVASLSYFFFSAEQRGALGKVSRLGIWFLMISFGASYGFTVMSRISLLIGRLQFLFQELPASIGIPGIG